MQTPRLQVRALSVRRGQRDVVVGVDLEVGRGEVVCISGPSGCGKSTLLRALARLEPASGQVILEGQDVVTIRPTTYRRRVSLVFQEPPMFEGTVADNVGYGPALRGTELREERLRELLSNFGLGWDMAARDASELSGGERQRVALARAMANEPDVLLLDEPTSALDPAATSLVLERIARLGQGGLSVVAVLHIEQQALEIGDTCYRMREGRLEVEQS